MSQTVTNDMPKSSVNIRFLTQGFGIVNPPAKTLVGWLKYTYYVTFKGQAYN